MTHPIRQFSIRGRRVHATLPDAVRDLPPNAILWEVTLDGFIPIAHRHSLSLSLNPTRLTAKEFKSCTA